MKPRNITEQTMSCTGLSLSLIEHDGRHYLECEGRQVDAAHLGYPARQLVSMMARPFRPARQPRLIFLGLGFGHAIKAAREALPQEKASFVVLPEAPALVDWLPVCLDENPIDDVRVLFDELTPFSFLNSKYLDSQGIFADLDHLEALAPKDWSILSPSVLANYHEHLKNGGLLGIISSRPVPGLEKELRKAGFDLATDLVPFSEKSKKNRTLYLARKGHYQRTH